jgi:riboflavin synthase
MFTGIITSISEILRADFLNKQMRLRIKPMCHSRVNPALDLIGDGNLYLRGESIAVNGVCLTVENYANDWFEAYVSAETSAITNLKNLQRNSLVNLERALQVGDRVSGHLVSGHVDTLARVIKILQIGESKKITLQFSKGFNDAIFVKGSVALDGVSLTVNRSTAETLEVNVIPETWRSTIIEHWRIGNVVNLEVEQKQLINAQKKIDMDYLYEYGFI